MPADLSDYVPVDERLAALRDAYPHAYLQPWRPWQLVDVGGTTYLVYEAACYLDPLDKCPGVGSAWEEVPGRTAFTRGSELQNAETSAWGRAIVAKLAADTKRGIASREEIEASRGERLASPTQVRRLERDVEERGLPDGVPWPLPVELTMRDAARFQALVDVLPRETAKPERVATLRQDPLPAVAAGADATAEGSGREESAPPGEVDRERSASRFVEDLHVAARPWRRRPYPYDGDNDARIRYWRTMLAAVPGIGPGKFLRNARDIAVERGLDVPAAPESIHDPELVDAITKWFDARADERSAAS